MIPTLTRIFRSAFGLPCWQVRWDVQIGLDLTFGPPVLELGKPRPIPPHISDEGRRTRSVLLFGSHWLGLGPDAWSIQFTSENRIGPRSSARQKGLAVAHLSGQILDFVEINLETGETAFAFDLGGLLVAKRPQNWRSHREDDLWTFRSSTDELEVRLRAAWSHRPIPGHASRPRLLADGSHKHLIIGRSGARAI